MSCLASCLLQQKEKLWNWDARAEITRLKPEASSSTRFRAEIAWRLSLTIMIPSLQSRKSFTDRKIFSKLWLQAGSVMTRITLNKNVVRVPHHCYKASRLIRPKTCCINVAFQSILRRLHLPSATTAQATASNIRQVTSNTLSYIKHRFCTQPILQIGYVER